MENSGVDFFLVARYSEKNIDVCTMFISPISGISKKEIGL
jgi:hypothetical protein